MIESVGQVQSLVHEELRALDLRAHREGMDAEVLQTRRERRPRRRCRRRSAVVVVLMRRDRRLRSRAGHHRWAERDCHNNEGDRTDLNRIVMKCMYEASVTA